MENYYKQKNKFIIMIELFFQIVFLFIAKKENS